MVKPQRCCKRLMLQVSSLHSESQHGYSLVVISTTVSVVTG